MSQKSKVVTNPAKVKELKSLILQEHLAIQNPLNRSIVGSRASFVIQFLLNEEGTNTDERYYDWDTSYQPIATWLKANGYWDTLVTQPKDITSIIIAKESTDSNTHYQELSYRFSQQLTNSKLVTVNRPQVIAELLDHSQQEVNFQNTNYILKLKFKDKSIAYRVLSSSEINPEIYKVLPE